MNLSSLKIGLIGCGDIGTRVGHLLHDAGAEVHAFRRQPECLPDNFHCHRLDVEDADSVKALSALALDYVLITLSPDKLDDTAYFQTYVQGLANILSALDRKALKKLFWVSSTSVYGQSDGSWVDEDSPLEPTRFSGKRQLEAEQLLADFGEQGCIIRFAGIYRDGRHRMVDKIKAGQLSANIGQDYYTNRIQVQDCAGIIAHLMQYAEAGNALASVYIGSDSSPVLYSDLIHWLADELDCELQAEGEAATPRIGSKRCSNKRLLDTGYQFIFPTYQDGFRAIIAV